MVQGQSEAERIENTDITALITEIKALNLSPSASAKALSKRCHLSRQEAYELLRKA